MSENSTPNASFVSWFRHASPYIHAHRERTFVVSIDGEAVLDANFPKLVQDLALLQALGVRLVLVYGARPQIDALMRQANAEIRYHLSLRITDAAAMRCVKAAYGALRVEIEALFSMGIADSPLRGAQAKVLSGNFVTAKPVGILEGVDLGLTGEVRKVDISTIRSALAANALVLIPALGYSPTGEALNLYGPDVAQVVATRLGADKLIFLSENEACCDRQNQAISNLVPHQVETLLAEREDLDAQMARMLRHGMQAVRGGVSRVHLVQRKFDGALLIELFTRDGIGTLISPEPFERLRTATLSDIGGIIELMRPLEKAGVLVRRSRERLEQEIERFFVMERDGLVIACAALFPFAAEKTAELACFIVHADYRRSGRGDELLAQMEKRALAAGLVKLFVLTTQTSQWFRERGFAPVDVSQLPEDRLKLYNWQRNSQVLLKKLT